MPNQTSTPSKKGSNSPPYAIVEASGKQFWLEENRYYDLNRLKAEIDETVVLDKVLLINDGKKIKLGNPYIKDAKVSVKVMAHQRGPKIIVYKMRPKKKTRRKNGHRQELTRVMVESLSGASATKTSKTSKKSTKETKTSKVAKET